MSIAYETFDVLTFDCYGTLIDWETGIATALRQALPGLAHLGDDTLLEAFARYEAAAEVPYQRYRKVLEQSVRQVAAEFGQPLGDEAAADVAGGTCDEA